MREDAASWERFFRSMIERGLRGVGLVVGDRCAGLVSTVNSMLPNARYQRCMGHFMRNVLSKTPPGHREWASAALKAVVAQENRESAMAKAGTVAGEMGERKLKAAANCLREGVGVYGQINVYGVTTKSERYKRSYWTRTAAGNGIGGRKAPVPYGP